MSEAMQEIVSEYANKGFVAVPTNLASTVVTMMEGGKDMYSALYVAIWEKDGELKVEEY